ncbi:hypothetical protein CVT24_006230 [Panaeolus cyanescens]|uniref:Uncharacterized protein n=1 Tax=Panaeolus cyanescens TaxID=181874 RepID=A0A409YEG0_9AGAR|nr:hypothetical protein CVT24_006230 [Panaeolus cyanescens]
MSLLSGISSGISVFLGHRNSRAKRNASPTQDEANASSDSHTLCQSLSNEAQHSFSSSASQHDTSSDSDIVTIDHPINRSSQSFDGHSQSVAHDSQEMGQHVSGTATDQRPQSGPDEPAVNECEDNQRGDGRSERRRKRSLRKPNGALKKDEAELKTLKDKIQNLQSALRMVNEGYKKLDLEKESLLADVKGLRGKLEAEEYHSELLRQQIVRNKELQDENRELHRRTQYLEQRMREERSISSQQCAQLQELLDVRTKDLNHAQAFLTLTDTYSGSDVRKMVEALNAEIFQASAFIADLLEGSPVGRATKLGWEECLPAASIEPLARVIGDRLMSIIAVRGPALREDTLPVQLAVQTSLVQWSLGLVNNFGDGTFGRQLEELYHRIRETETQAVAARWRVMTSKSVVKSSRISADGFDSLVLGILGLLRMGGWDDTNHESMIVNITGTLADVENQAMKIKAAIREHIMSCDMYLTAVSPEDRFDQAAMEDGYPTGRRKASGRQLTGQEVLCAVGLGLTKSTNLPSDDGQYASRQEVILRSKVALTSIASSLERSD